MFGNSISSPVISKGEGNEIMKMIIKIVFILIICRIYVPNPLFIEAVLVRLLTQNQLPFIVNC